MSLVATPIVTTFDIVENNNIASLSKSKVDISTYNINNEKVFIKESEPDVHMYVYMQMMERYPSYTDFFFDLIVNRNLYLISGDGFIYPNDPAGVIYNITVYAMPTNELFTGKINFEITLLPEKERIDLSKFSDLFDKNDKNKHGKVTINKSDVTSSLKIEKRDVLKSIDNYFVELGVEEWIHTTSNTLLQDNIDEIDVTIDNPYETLGYVEGYYRVVVSPKNGNEQFMPYILTAYIHAEFKYDTIKNNVSHSINWKLSANWSTVNKYNWENNNVWYKALNIKDYITSNELSTSNGDYKKAFASKYDKIKFYTTGYAKDYDDYRWSLTNPEFTLQEFDEQNVLVSNIVSFKLTGFGVYSEVKHYITLRINNELDIEYNVYGFIGVQGFGAKWQHTSLVSDIYRWEIS